mgnify:CR=1 FL=1
MTAQGSDKKGANFFCLFVCLFLCRRGGHHPTHADSLYRKSPAEFKVSSFLFVSPWAVFLGGWGMECWIGDLATNTRRDLCEI